MFNFDAIVNEIKVFISFSEHLLVYKNATGFWVLILSPATLLNLLIACNRFQVASLELFYI